MIKLDDKLISYLEGLSNLKLNDNEKEQVIADMEKSLELMSKICELDITDVPERSHPFDHVNDFRDDVVTPSFDRALLLQNANEHNGEMFIAPRTVGD